MSDPVAEAAAQIAAQREPQVIQSDDVGLVETLVGVVHDLEAKVEHLIHPDAEAGTATAGESATAGAASSESNTSVAELPNGAPTQPVGAATAAAGDVPNAVSAVAEPTAEPASALSAAGENTTSPIAANSGEKPLHVRMAAHLEAIYEMAQKHVESAPAAAVADTSALKTHVGDILHRISNGMAVTEGELVSKLEALYRML